MATNNDDRNPERLEFEWDEQKAVQNAQKHGVTFDEAETAFADPNSIDVFDPDHSEDEDRYVKLGKSNIGRLLVIMHTHRGSRIRIISARRANRREQEQYEKRH